MAELGSDPCRLYLFGEATTLTPEKPYAVWQIVGGDPFNYINQVPDIDGYAVQVDVYADTVSDARNAAEALRDAIEPVAHITSWRGEMRDPTTKDYRYSFDVDWLTPR